MRILFLGGTGNISAECAALLHGRGHEIFVLSRGRSAVPPEYQAQVADRHDVAALQRVAAASRPDIVINFLGYDVADVQLDYDVFRGCVRQYVFISSATVYAKPPPRLPIAEASPLGNPFWEYAQKKLACEQWLASRGREAGFPVTIVRPSHTYSRRWVPNPVASSSFSFALRLAQGKPVFVPDDGENPWTLTAAVDFAVGLAGLIDNPGALGQAVHITSDEVLSWNQIVAEIAAAVADPGTPPPVIHQIPTEFICRHAPHLAGGLKGDKAHPGVFDNSKIKQLVPGFRCQVPFRSGVRESVAWLRAHPEQQNLNPQVDETCQRVVEAWQAAGQSRT